MRTRKSILPMLVVLVLAVVGPVAFGEAPPDFGSTYRASKPCGQEQAGYLVVPAKEAHFGRNLVAEPYYPRPGDILLYDTGETLYRVAMKVAGSDVPIHAAIIIERADGTPAILEVGPNSQPAAFTKTYIIEVQPRLASYPGVIIVRRSRVALSPERSAELTRFAEAQQGKKFAVGRLALQGTPFRPRCGLRHMLFAKTIFDRDRWICSENVVAAATIAGLLDPNVHFANAMYPRDLAYDEDYDLSATYHSPLVWVADPNPIVEGDRLVHPEKKKR